MLLVPRITFTVSGPEATGCPLLSVATATNWCGPIAACVVSHGTVNGGVVSGVPKLTPSSVNCTAATFPVVATVTGTRLATVPVLTGEVKTRVMARRNAAVLRGFWYTMGQSFTAALKGVPVVSTTATPAAPLRAPVFAA